MGGKAHKEVVRGVGERISVLLRRHPTIGTQTALAEAAHVSRETLSRAVNFDTLTRSTARAIAKALAVPLDVLLSGSEAVAPAPAPIASSEELELYRGAADALRALVGHMVREELAAQISGGTAANEPAEQLRTTRGVPVTPSTGEDSA